MKKSQSSVFVRMLTTVAIFTAVVIALGLFTAHTLSKVRVGGPYYTQIVQSKDLVADILPPPAYILEAYLLSFQIVNTGNATEREQYVTRLGQTEKEFHERQQVWRDALPESRMKAALVKDSAKQAEVFFKLANERLLPAVKAGDLESARRLVTTEMHDSYVQHRQYIDEVVKLANQYGADREQEAATAIRQSTIWEIALGVVGLSFGIVFSFISIRRLTRTLRQLALSMTEGSWQVVSAAAQVSGSSQTLAEGASEQAASIEETSASIEELSSITKRNAENAQKVNELSRQARTAADTGASDMHAMNQAMEAIKTSSDDIAKIIKTIDEIAFQTNILALNAAVEAARAGEAGMGFAVVADEVRNLARRCAQSAKETSSKIEGALTRTTEGVELSAKVTQGLQEILAKIRQVDELAAEVANASNEQSTGISQVSVAVSQMDKVTQSTAASAEESAAAAEELNSQAEAMKDVVGDLLRMVDGTRHAAGTSSARKPSAQAVVAAEAKHSATRQHSAAAPVTHNASKRRATVEPVAAGSRNGGEISFPADFKDF